MLGKGKPEEVGRGKGNLGKIGELLDRWMKSWSGSGVGIGIGCRLDCRDKYLGVFLKERVWMKKEV